MGILNITWNGLSADYPLEADHALSDADLRRIAAELIAAGELTGIPAGTVDARVFDHYVVDRFRSPLGDERIYLRPKVPFGA